jgi:hypothetical protein
MNKKKFLNFFIIFFFEIIKISMIYYDIVIWVMKIIKSVTYHNYDDFHHVNFIFSQKNYFTIRFITLLLILHY